jgi:hypothetical protein
LKTEKWRKRRILIKTTRRMMLKLCSREVPEEEVLSKGLPQSSQVVVVGTRESKHLCHREHRGAT